MNSSAGASRYELLSTLLVRLFSGDQLRRFLLGGREGVVVAVELPGSGSSLAQIAGAAVEELERQGCVDSDFFVRLEAARPHRAGDIRPVAGAWGVRMDGARPSTSSVSNPDTGGWQERRPLRLFISYSHRDADLIEDLRAHLSPLVRRGMMEYWYDREILPGDAWRNVISNRLSESDIVLLAVSSYFVASDYCFDVEMRQALQQVDAGTSRVVPIFLRPCVWSDTPFAHLQGLPPSGSPVTDSKDPHQAWAAVTRGIQRLLETMK